MTAYEAIDLLQQYISETNQLQFGYFSILSAFLVMSYLISHKLNYVLITIILVLFTAFVLNFVFQIYALNLELDNLVAYISEQKNIGNYDIPWSSSEGSVTPIMLTIIQTTSTLGGYLGCIAFFFFQRHQKQKELEP